MSRKETHVHRGPKHRTRDFTIFITAVVIVAAIALRVAARPRMPKRNGKVEP